MGWKTRGGRRYYYQSEREGGRVVSRYVGSGEAASLIAEMAAIDREKRQLDAADMRAKRERAERLSARIDRACRRLTAAAGAILSAAGYHRHHRGPWRKRRTMSSDAAPAPIAPADPSLDLAARYRAGDKAARAEVVALIDAADKGKPDAARDVARLMTAAPEVAGWFRTDMARVAEDRLIRRTYGKDALASAEAVRRKLASLRAELAGPNPSAVERLLAERAALCWLDCYHWEYLDADPPQRSIAQADLMARQRDRAHRRYLSALKALAAVRKLPIVAVQVNVGADAGPRG